MYRCTSTHLELLLKFRLRVRDHFLLDFAEMDILLGLSSVLGVLRSAMMLGRKEE